MNKFTKIKKFFSEKKFFLAGLLLLLAVVAVNFFPRGYIVVGGDTSQFINAKNNFSRYLYEWNGAPAIFYSFFYLLSIIGFSDSSQLSFYLGIFIVGSYLSFRLFTAIIFPRISDLISSALSLFYALNLYTLYIFTYAWGYSHYQFLYIFIPLLIGIYLKFLTTKKNIFGALFVLVLFLSSSGFGNPAFALSFFILLFFLTMTLYFFGWFSIKKRFFVQVIFWGIILVLANLYWILPIIPRMNVGVSDLFYNNPIDFNWWLMHTSNPIVDTMILGQDNSWYFPHNFPYKKILFLQNFFVILAFLPAALIFFGLFKMKSFEKKNRVLFLCFTICFLLLVLLIAKVRPPFEIINHYIYNLWGINTLRGYEKFAIFTPFVFASLLLILFLEIKQYRKKLYPILFLIIITPLPFYIGKLQQNMSAQFYTYKIQNRDYQKADHSFLIKIPYEYYEMSKILNKDSRKSMVMVLPDAKSDGWSDYPKWKLYGVDPTELLHDKRYIRATTDFPGWNFLKDFRESENINTSWLVKLAGMMNSKYIIFHKDCSEESIEKTLSKAEKMERDNMVRKLADNDYFILYEINEDYFIPYISWQKGFAEIGKSPESVEENFDNIKTTVSPAVFREINPKKYEVRINDSADKNLVLARTFNPLWKAYYVSESGKETEINNHYIARGYANGWKIDDKNGIEKIIIEYYPSRLMIPGIIISLITILFLSGYLLRYYYVENRQKKA